MRRSCSQPIKQLISAALLISCNVTRESIFLQPKDHLYTQRADIESESLSTVPCRRLNGRIMVKIQ